MTGAVMCGDECREGACGRGGVRGRQRGRATFSAAATEVTAVMQMVMVMMADEPYV